MNTSSVGKAINQDKPQAPIQILKKPSIKPRLKAELTPDTTRVIKPDINKGFNSFADFLGNFFIAVALFISSLCLSALWHQQALVSNYVYNFLIDHNL